jgi:hypothetical protein
MFRILDSLDLVLSDMLLLRNITNMLARIAAFPAEEFADSRRQIFDEIPKSVLLPVHEQWQTRFGWRMGQRGKYSNNQVLNRDSHGHRVRKAQALSF